MIKRLLSLELQGVKTFATMSRLEFPGQITAIVGPNGSGKSNIADSVRWVLGEQTFSLLRAKRTDDMIFSGSQQRSRSGMATANITFDNRDGWLPIDFSEVSIARRAYRDGQNEYLLNGQKVRLKDISELLSHTGLSERTYTIIGQGLVDATLALKPDERRELFEEAAGIGLYRSRKEEAVRRLENTRKNLDRVLDIMTEIKPRLRSLERQAARFIEYFQVQSSLQSVLKDWYGYHWHQKQQDVIKSRNAYQDHEKFLTSLRDENQRIGADVEKKRSELQSVRKELESAYAELSSYHRTLEQTTRELAVLDERQRSYHQQKSNLEIDIANVEQELSELSSQEQIFQAEIEQKSNEYESARAQVKQVETSLATMNDQKDRVESKLQSIRTNRIALETKKVQLTARLDELNNRVASLDSEKLKIVQAINQLEGEIHGSDDTILDLEIAYNEKEAAYTSILEELEKVSGELDDLEGEMQTVQLSLAEQETNHAKLSAQIEVLTQAEAALQGYSEGSRKMLEDSRNGKLPRGIEPLSRYIIVEEIYEKAIGAALGELSDLLVLPSDGRDIVIQYLEAKDNDRVAMVPLDTVNINRKKARLQPSDGVYGYANELIDVDPKYRRVVDQLFSDTIIVRDSTTALKIRSKLDQFERTVTLNGLVFQANGVMLSGQSASGKRMGRTRRQSELQLEMRSLEEKIKDLTQQKASFVQKVEKLSEKQNRLSQEQKKLDLERKEAAKRHQDAIESLRRLNEQLKWHQTQLGNTDSVLEESQISIQQSQKELQGIETEINQLLTSEKEISAELEELSLFELQQDLNYWQTHQIVTKNGLESARQRFQDHLKRIEDSSARLNTFRERIENSDNQLAEINLKNKDMGNQVSQVNATIDSLKSEHIDIRNRHMDELAAEVAELEETEAQTHQKVVEGERQLTQLQLDMNRREDQLNLLMEKVEDDFSLVSHEYAEESEITAPISFAETIIQKLPKVFEIPDATEGNIKNLKSQLRRIGAVNPEAQKEYLEVKERFEFLSAQISDLEAASKDLHDVIEKLDEMMARDFVQTFKAVNQEFSEYFKRLFNGGDAQLKFADEDNPVEGGIDIEARLPGRRRQELALLSGGERSLTAVALIFALLKVSPTPFCILDEVDAMLDESNVGRFVELLKELSQKTQFVIITHNRNTVQAADVIYGVTMGRDSTSQMISLKLEEVDEAYLE